MTSGAMTVRYQGEEYAVVGVYFAPAGSRHHDLCYVLRQDLGNGSGIVPPRTGTNPAKLQGPGTAREGACAIPSS
jgi:hypothetical protein